MNKRLSLFILALLASLSLFAQSRRTHRRMTRLADQYLFSTTLSPAAFTQSIPFDSTYGAIILPVGIDGKTYNFVFDTGAPTAVSDTLARAMG